MPTHLTSRLVWHDNAWDGCVCQKPSSNTSCIAHQHVRESRDGEKEDEHHGVSLSELTDWLPPCSRDTGAYSKHPYAALHSDPLEFRRLPSVSEIVPPFSNCPSPYRWMREDNFRHICETEGLNIRGPDEAKETGWVIEPDRQIDLLAAFWGKLEKRRSLIFYYCKDGHPFDRESPRVIVGIGRIKEIGPQVYFGESKKTPGNFPIWSRCITQDYPEQGVRLPYQEYLAAGLAVEPILCPVPRAAEAHFSYVAEHITDDVALSVVERFIRSVERVRDDAKIAGDWDAQLAWLNNVLSELWRGRGSFPGLGSMLEFLGCATGTTFQRDELAPVARSSKNPLEYVLSILAGTAPIPSGPHANGLKAAKTKWAKIPSRHALLATLAKFELTNEQLLRVADVGERAKAGICATESELVANPYLLSELDGGTDSSEPIALDTIDHGMLPEGDAALFVKEDRMPPDDPRRVRGTAADLLSETALSGDTVLEAQDLMDRIRTRFSKSRACLPDLEIFTSDVIFYQERLWTDLTHRPPLVALKVLQKLEADSADLLRLRAINPVRKVGPEPDWATTLAKRFGKPKRDREKNALTEKAKALATLFTRKLSLLVGGAGTGKTTVLQVFLDELEKSEGKQPILLLAPTGKARVRLAANTGREAQTIHYFLLKSGWVTAGTYRLKETGGIKFSATTVVVDECSMIAVDLFGTLLRALDSGSLKRLILVGDPNQLPPIGPGRPFVDLLRWTDINAASCLARLRTCMRTAEGDEKESFGLTLADTYRTDGAHAGDDEAIAALGRGEACGDLECHFWSNHQELMRILKERMQGLLGIIPGDYETFNRSLGILPTGNKYEQSEAWQILCATRGELSGTEELNRLVQLEFRGGILVKARRGRTPRPFGDREIVWCDKVMQVRNRNWKAWPQSPSNLDYVANGEIGLVDKTYDKNLTVGFSTQPDVTYSYTRGSVDQYLELGYALTTHKAQGSDFDIVFVVIPRDAATLSRELIYTAMTRFRKRLILLVEKNLEPLLRLRAPEQSNTEQRNTQMFAVQLRPSATELYRPEGLIHRTHNGVAVRSKSEVIVAEALGRLNIGFVYEKPLLNPNDSRDFRLPDFTISWQGEEFYWEHLGMLTIPAYQEAWERKLAWYKRHGFIDRLVTSSDKPDGGIDAQLIEQIARQRILES